mgnify:CR=1 FL=1
MSKVSDMLLNDDEYDFFVSGGNIDQIAYEAGYLDAEKGRDRAVIDTDKTSFGMNYSKGYEQGLSAF